jgi:hypothetical protein
MQTVAKLRPGDATTNVACAQVFELGYAVYVRKNAAAAGDHDEDHRQQGETKQIA